MTTPDHVLIPYLEENFAAMKSDIHRLGQKVGQIDSNTRDLGVQFEALNTKVDRIVEVIENDLTYQGRTQKLEVRMDAMEHGIATVKPIIREHSADITELKARF